MTKLCCFKFRRACHTELPTAGIQQCSLHYQLISNPDWITYQHTAWLWRFCLFSWEYLIYPLPYATWPCPSFYNLVNYWFNMKKIALILFYFLLAIPNHCSSVCFLIALMEIVQVFTFFMLITFWFCYCFLKKNLFFVQIFGMHYGIYWC